MTQIDDLDLTFQEKADPKSLEIMAKIGNALAMIYKSIPKSVILPRIFQVKGQVEITKQPSVKIQNLDELERYFKSLESMLRTFAQAASTAPAPIVNIPKFDMPKGTGMSPKMEALLESLNDKIGDLRPAKESKLSMSKTENLLESLINKPTFTPQPVTNISINALQGLIKTSNDTVGTGLTPLPSYGRLFNRRAIQIYNNSSNTIYIGGSDVTATNGFPVTGNNFSPTIDAGYNMIVYGIAATGSNNVRVMEVATKSEGGVAIQS